MFRRHGTCYVFQTPLKPQKKTSFLRLSTRRKIRFWKMCFASFVLGKKFCWSANTTLPLAREILERLLRYIRKVPSLSHSQSFPLFILSLSLPPSTFFYLTRTHTLSLPFPFSFSTLSLSLSLTHSLYLSSSIPSSISVCLTHSLHLLLFSLPLSLFLCSTYISHTHTHNHTHTLSHSLSLFHSL